MENEKIEINAENNINQQNSNSEVKPRNKKVTIVLATLIILLILAIGVCAGLWLAGDTTKIINNKEEVAKEDENSKTEESADNSQNSTNEVNQNNTNVSSISKIFSTELKNIEEASIAKLDVSFNDSRTTLQIDINNDGKSDILRVEEIIDNDGMYGDGYKLFLNDELFFSTEDNTEQSVFWHLRKIYFVDLDSTDSYCDLVLLGNYGGPDYVYMIFKYNGTTFEPIIDSSSSSIFILEGNCMRMYVDNKGILVPRNGVFANTYPILSDIYYLYRENKVYEVPMENYTNELIEFKNVYFTTDLKNIENYLERAYIESNYNYDDEYILISEEIYAYRNVKAYVVENNIDNYASDCMIKVKLEDGRLGYIFVARGVLAG